MTILYRFSNKQKHFLINKTHQVFAVVAAERDVEEFGLLSQLAEARADVRLEVVPPEKNRIDWIGRFILF